VADRIVTPDVAAFQQWVKRGGLDAAVRETVYRQGLARAAFLAGYVFAKATAEEQHPAPATLSVHATRDDYPDAGGVYFMRCGPYVKIGQSQNIRARCRELQTTAPEDAKLEAFLPIKSRYEARKLERELHRRFWALRNRGEWFRWEDPLVAYVRGLRL
jgi:hypothetical protein